jgi:hypothetical protein
MTTESVEEIRARFERETWGIWVTMADGSGKWSERSGYPVTYTEEQANEALQHVVSPPGGICREARPFPKVSPGSREDRLQQFLLDHGRIVVAPFGHGETIERFARVAVDSDGDVAWTTHEEIHDASDSALADLMQGWACDGLIDLDTGYRYELVVRGNWERKY